MVRKSFRLFLGLMKTKQFPTKVQYLENPEKRMSTLFCTLATLFPLVYLKQWLHLWSSNEAEVRFLKYFYREDDSPAKATFTINILMRIVLWDLEEETQREWKTDPLRISWYSWLTDSELILTVSKAWKWTLKASNCPCLCLMIIFKVTGGWLRSSAVLKGDKLC